MPIGIILVIFASVCSWSPSSYAIDRSAKYQLHFRGGLMQGSYSGASIESRTFMVPTTTDIEVEAFIDRDEAFTLRAMMAMEMSNNRVNYTYAGAGKTYYLGARGRKEVKSERSVQITMIPKTRSYWGYSVGIAQVLAIPFGLVLSAYSTTLDASVATGLIHQITPNLGLEGQLGVGMGYGFSTVTVTGMTIRGLFGVTYFF